MRKFPKKRNVFADTYVELVNNGKIVKFESIDEDLVPPGYTIHKYEDHVVFYKIEQNELTIPQVTKLIRIEYLYQSGSAIAMTCQEKVC